MKQFGEQWVRKLKEGDEEAFRVFYRVFSAPLLNHIYRMLGNESLAEELLQETFVLVLKKLDFYQERSELENGFRSWVFRLATNRAIDEIRCLKRKKTKKKKAELDAYERSTREPGPESRLIQGQLEQSLEELIDKLPSTQRTFLNLKVVEEMNYKEIADICGCNTNAVKQGIFRARENLKKLMTKEGVSL